MAHAPPIGAMRYFQMKTTAPPVIMPASAPCLFARFQKSEKSITGPNAAPKPAHANETTRNTELLGAHASTMPIRAMPMTVARAANIVVRWFIFMPNECCMRSCDTLDAAAKSCESAVDIVAARMPERMMPAMTASSTPCWLIRSASLMIMVSDSALVVRKGTLPAADTL